MTADIWPARLTQLPTPSAFSPPNQDTFLPGPNLSLLGDYLLAIDILSLNSVRRRPDPETSGHALPPCGVLPTWWSSVWRSWERLRREAPCRRSDPDCRGGRSPFQPCRCLCRCWPSGLGNMDSPGPSLSSNRALSLPVLAFPDLAPLDYLALGVYVRRIRTTRGSPAAAEEAGRATAMSLMAWHALCRSSERGISARWPSGRSIHPGAARP